MTQTENRMGASDGSRKRLCELSTAISTAATLMNRR